jgi:predicted transcriptional regulator
MRAGRRCGRGGEDDKSHSECYIRLMTKTEIDAVFDRVRTWPPERQEDAVRVLLQMEAAGTGVYVLDDEERAAIEEGMAQARRGEFATDEEVAALFNRYRRA